MIKNLITRALVALLLAAGAAHADEAKIRQAVEAAVGAKPEAVRKTNILGLYEVVVGGDILYTDEKGNYIITGNIIDAKKRINFSQQRMNKLSSINYAAFTLALDETTVKGDDHTGSPH